MLAWEIPGLSCYIRTATAAAFSAAAEVPKNEGRFCERLDGVVVGVVVVGELPGWVRLAGLRTCVVLKLEPGGKKNDVFPPSAAEMSGLFRIVGVVGVPSGLNRISRGPNELKGSFTKLVLPGR